VTHVDDRPWHADPWDDPALGDDDTTEVGRQRAPRSWRRVVLVAAFLAMASVVAVGLVGLWYTGQVNPAGDPGDPITFTVNADDTVQTVAMVKALARLASTIGISITSGGIGKNELSMNDTTASAHRARG